MTKKLNLLAVLLLLLLSCNNSETTKITIPERDSVKAIAYPATGNFYSTPADSSALLVANPVIYDVEFSNPYDDEWIDSCFKHLDVQAIRNIIFNAVYQERLIPYHYYIQDSALSIQNVKDIEKSILNDKNKIGKLQFNEVWYFDEANMRMSKKVQYIIFGIEVKNDAGEIRYKPGFKVFLN